MIVIAEILPLDTVAGARKLVRLTTDNTVDGTGVNEKIWTPAITEPPVIGIRLFKGDFDNTASASGGSIKIALDRLQIDEPYARRYLWAGAPIKLWAGVSGQAWPWQQVFEGQINSFSAEGSILDLKTKVNEEPFQANVLINKYAGTGGIEGGIDLKDKPKPMLLGRCFNAQPVQINSVYHVYQFHGYGPIQGISGLFERGSNFGAVFGDYTDYASLVAAPIPNGSWATCLAQGLIRLGAPAYGVITADVDGDKGSGIFRRKPGQIVLRLCEIAAVANTAIEISSFAALDLRLAALPNQGRIGHYQTDQTDILSLSASICSDVVHVCGVSLLGKLFASPLTISPPNIRLDAQARELPKVYSSVEKQVSPPYSLIEMGYARSWKVHSADEIAFIEPAQPGATNDANLSDPTQLTINEKIRLTTTEATRANRRLALRTRMLAQGLSVAALDQALVDWFVVRNGVSPAWDNTAAHTTINRVTWNAVSLAYDAALDASDIAISQEDARRSIWDQTTGRPPLLTGDSVTADDTLLDPTVWINSDCVFSVDATGEGFVSSNLSGRLYLYHKPESATPIDFTATYEAAFELKETGSGAPATTNYIVIVAYDNLGNIIAGDGSLWHYPYYGALQSCSVWEKQSTRFGQGTKRPFPPNAVKFGLGVLLDYNQAGVITSARRLKTRRITRNNFTAAAPYKWTLGDDQLIRNVGVTGWGNVAYSKALIFGPQKFNANFAGPLAIQTIICLSEVNAPVYFGNNAGAIYFNHAYETVDIYEAEVFRASYASIANARTAQFEIEYDGLRLRYYVNGVALSHNTFVGPNKSYRAMIDTFYPGSGIVNVTHASSQGAAIVGTNTYSSGGTALSPQDLMNNVIGIVNGQFVNPAGSGSGTSVANSSILLQANGTASYFNGTSYVTLGTVSLGGLGAGALAFRDKTTYFSTAEPTSPTPQENEQWCNPTTREIRVYAGGAWASPIADLTGASQLTIAGVDDITINFDHANNALTSLPKVQRFKVTRGGVDVTAAAALSVTVRSGAISASIAADGLLSIDKSGGVLTSAVLELGGTYGAAALPTKTVRITRENAAAPNSPPSTGVGSPTADSTRFNGTTTSATPTAVSRELVLVVGSAGIVTLNGNYEFSVNTQPSSTQNYGLATRWYKWNGSAFIAIGASIPAYTNYNAEKFEGTGECGFTDTGNAPASTQKYKLIAININPAANFGTRTISGDVSATGVNP